MNKARVLYNNTRGINCSVRIKIIINDLFEIFFKVKLYNKNNNNKLILPQNCQKTRISKYIIEIYESI